MKNITSKYATPCTHQHVHVFLYEESMEKYTFSNGELVESETDYEPQPVHTFDIWCKDCLTSFNFDVTDPELPTWAKALYNTAFQTSYGEEEQTQ